MSRSSERWWQASRFICLAALCAPAVCRPAWAASKFVKNLHKAESRKEASERLEYYTRALDSWDDAEGSELLAQCYFGRGQALVELWRFSDAEPDLSKVITMDQLNNKAWLLRGKARLRQDKIGEAVSDLVEYAGREPADVDGLDTLAQAQLKAGRGDLALKACKLAQEADASDARGWLCEGRVMMDRKDWQAADKALSLADDKSGHGSTETLLDRAVCRVALGRDEAALKDYGTAVPLMEARLLRLRHESAPPPALTEQTEGTARAFYGRGRVEEFLAQNEAALADYTSACNLGHDEACARADALAPQKPHKPPKRKKIKNPDSEPGDRIYGS